MINNVGDLLKVLTSYSDECPINMPIMVNYCHKGDMGGIIIEVAQKKEEAPETVDNTTKVTTCPAFLVGHSCAWSLTNTFCGGSPCEAAPVKQ